MKDILFVTVIIVSFFLGLTFVVLDVSPFLGIILFFYSVIIFSIGLSQSIEEK